MFYDSYQNWYWPFIFILLAGVLPTVVWRWAGAVLVGRLDENSQALVFIRCVATSLVAAVIAQFIFYPTGALSDVPVLIRLTAALIGFCAFILSGQRMLVGIVVTEALLVLGVLMVGG